MAIIGGTMLLARVIKLLFEDSTPAWESKSTTQASANAVLANENAIQEMAKKVGKT